MNTTHLILSAIVLSIAFLLIRYGSSPSKPVDLCKRFYGFLLKRQYDKAGLFLGKNGVNEAFFNADFQEKITREFEEKGGLKDIFFHEENPIAADKMEVVYTEFYENAAQERIFIVCEKINNKWKIKSFNKTAEENSIIENEAETNE